MKKMTSRLWELQRDSKGLFAIGAVGALLSYALARSLRAARWSRLRGCGGPGGLVSLTLRLLGLGVSFRSTMVMSTDGVDNRDRWWRLLHVSFCVSVCGSYIGFQRCRAPTRVHRD